METNTSPSSHTRASMVLEVTMRDGNSLKVNPSVASAQLRCFRSDYEGWKPSRAFKISSPIPTPPVLEVTMRDGNFASAFALTVGFIFWF